MTTAVRDDTLTTAHRLFGLTVRSSLPLPLPTLDDSPAPDVEIVRGRVRSGREVICRFDAPPFCCTRTATSIVLAWSGMRFDVAPDRVVVDTVAAEAAVIPLMQAAWSVVLSARGREALHASVVARDGTAVGICGPSGSGKSTAALAMLDAGWSLVSDDLLTLDDDGRVVPGPPFIRLLPDRAAGRAGAWDASGKLRHAPAVVGQPVRLGALLVHAEAYHAIQRLSPVAAVEALLDNIYNDVLMHHGQALRRLDFALALARQVPVYGVPPRSLTVNSIAQLAGASR